MLFWKCKIQAGYVISTCRRPVPPTCKTSAFISCECILMFNLYISTPFQRKRSLCNHAQCPLVWQYVHTSHVPKHHCPSTGTVPVAMTLTTSEHRLTLKISLSLGMCDGAAAITLFGDFRWLTEMTVWISSGYGVFLAWMVKGPVPFPVDLFLPLNLRQK